MLFVLTEIYNYVSQEKWSALLDIKSILISIQSLLGGNSSSMIDLLYIIPVYHCNIEPNIDSPLNTEAAELWSKQDG